MPLVVNRFEPRLRHPEPPSAAPSRPVPTQTARTHPGTRKRVPERTLSQNTPQPSRNAARPFRARLHPSRTTRRPEAAFAHPETPHPFRHAAIRSDTPRVSECRNPFQNASRLGTPRPVPERPASRGRVPACRNASCIKTGVFVRTRLTLYRDARIGPGTGSPPP